MAESEDELLARIAKHNGTTVEFEREKQLRRKLGAKDVDDNSIDAIAARRRAAMNATPEERERLGLAREADPALTAQQIAAAQSNPWRAGVVAVWVVALLIGVILLWVGASDYAALDPESGHTDPGLVQMFSGSSLLTIGVVGFIAWMAAEMVLWKPKS